MCQLPLGTLESTKSLLEDSHCALSSVHTTSFEEFHGATLIRGESGNFGDDLTYHLSAGSKGLKNKVSTGRVTKGKRTPRRLLGLVRTARVETTCPELSPTTIPVLGPFRLGATILLVIEAVITHEKNAPQFA